MNQLSAPLCCQAVRLRIDHSEIPALAVLHRRRPVGIQHVALVEDGVGDLFHDVSRSQLHRFFASGQHSFNHLLPRRDSVAHFVLIKPVEHISPQVKPRAVRIVVIDQFLPGF